MMAFVAGCVVLGIVAGAVWLGTKVEAVRVQAATDSARVQIRDAKHAAETQVRGMDDEELDALVYGPDDTTDPGRVPAGDIDRGRA